MIRVLHILSSLDGGGVEAMITNYYYNFPKKDIVFDFAIHNPKVGILENELLNNGSKIYHITPKKINLLKNIKELFHIINKKNYDIIYCHQNFISWIPLTIAKIKGIRIRIIHSHGCNPPKTLKKKIYNKISRLLIKLSATNYFACGTAAANWLYGKKWKVSYPKNVLIKNAINIDKFSYSEEIRNSLRKKYNVSDKKCIFHAGRFSYEKNHKFIIELMTKLSPENYHLFLAGNGELLDEMKEYAESLKINNITFLGIRKDVNQLYSMADIFLLPSLHEGFPVTLVEAQASSLKCIVSTNVSAETKIISKTKYISLNERDKWIKEIKNADIQPRCTEYKLIQNFGFEIKTESLKLYNLLKLLVNKK